MLETVPWKKDNVTRADNLDFQLAGEMIRILAAIGNHLPRVAEEGADQESIDESVLVQSIAPLTDSMASATLAIKLVRELLLSCSCLDARAAAEARWRFVSFPAYLFARSSLLGLGNGDLSLLDRGFWEPGGTGAHRQHDLLHRIESRRQTACGNNAPPIRRVWVAWSLLSVDGKFLMVRREDATPERLDSFGSFVLPGGRVSPGDLSSSSLSERLDFFDPRVPAAMSDALPVLERTLRRELLEELYLESTDLVAIAPLGEVVTYRALEGANAAHAVTEYLLQTFRVTLSVPGKRTFLRTLAKYPDRFEWFTADELVAKKNARGYTAFVDALLELPSAVRDALFGDVGISVALGSDLPSEIEVDIPWLNDESFAIGSAGRERFRSINLREEERRLLAFLAVIRRGESASSLQVGVQVVPGTGWVLLESLELFERMKALAQRLTRLDAGWTPLSIEGRAIRLNCAQATGPCLAGSAFALAIQQLGVDERFKLRLTRARIDCVLGSVEERNEEIVVPHQVGTAITDLVAGKLSTFTTSRWDSIKRQQYDVLREFCARMGLRILMRQQNGKPVLTVPPTPGPA